jgi:hypothetical protein
MTPIESKLAEIEERLRAKWQAGILQMRADLTSQGCSDVDEEIVGATALFEEQLAEGMEAARNWIVDTIAETMGRPPTEMKH